ADLSAGKVCDGKITCPYHGWSVDPAGELFSPLEGKAKGQTEVFELGERFGLLWLNPDEAHFEALVRAGGGFMGPMTCRYDAPLHVPAHGFSDGAPVPWVHARNGANPTQASETVFNWREDDDGVTIEYDYAQRPGTLMTLLNGFRTTRWSTRARFEFRP